MPVSTPPACAAVPRVARVLLIDDHPIVRHGLKELLHCEPDLEVCGEARDPQRVLAIISEQAPELVIVDIALEAYNGIELIRRIRSKSPCTGILAVSIHDEMLYAERALRAGARGYIQKNAEVEALIEAVRQVLGGHIYISSAVSNHLFRRRLRQESDGDASDPVNILSDRELAVFELIGQGYTIRQIAERLGLGRKTIETYRDHVRSKLLLKNSTELFREAVLWVHRTR